MIIEKTKNALFYTNSWINWLLLLMFIANLFLPGYNYGLGTYPMSALAITIIAFCLYHFKLRILSLLPLSLALLINIQHMGRDPKVFFSYPTGEYRLNKDITTIEYYPDQHIKSINVLRPGGTDSTSLLFDENGNLSRYENVQQNAPYNRLSFSSSGNLAEKVSLKNGKQDGTLLTFYPSGNIQTAYYFTNGQRDLEQIDYYDTSLLKRSSAIYFDEAAHRYYKEYFDEKGNLIKKEGL